MRLGDTVTWNGRRYIVRGLDPMGVSERCADLEDAETGAPARARVDELEPA